MAASTRIARRAWLVGVAAAAAAGIGGRAAAAPPAAPDYGALIDAAGRQRMLSQRIVKAYCQVGLNVMPAVSRAQLDGAVRRFDRQLATLTQSAPNTAVRTALAREAKLWRPFRAVAAAPVRRSGAAFLAERDEELLLAAHDVVLELVDAAKTSEAELVNIAGRQRMLSQRLAKLYMLRAWQLDTAGQRERMDTATREFGDALERLRAAPENTAVITAELEAVARQWEWFASAIALQGAQSYTLIVADASESILGGMEIVTGLYAALARG